jgi:hypothetical protein
MKKIAVFVCLALLSAATAFAEDAKPAGLNPDDVKAALGLSIYLQGGYTYNGNAGINADGQPEENGLRIFDHKANSFTLDLAEIVINKDAAAGTAGYKLKLSAGETAKWIHSRGLSGAALSDPQSGEGTDSIDLSEAYLSYIVNVGKGLRFDLGKMGTFIGAEVMEALDDPNYSRSFLFNYAEPLTHTGLKTSYAFSDALSAAVFIVNGWDNSTDNNRSKSYGASVTYAPLNLLSLTVNGITGPEQDQTSTPSAGSVGSNKRSLLDVVATIKPLKDLSFIFNTDNGREQNAPGVGGPATWSGISGIAKYDVNDTYSIALRGETFGDKEGYRIGSGPVRVKEVTLTPEIRLKGGLSLKPEYRHDSASAPVFNDGVNAKSSQNTIALGAMYRW